MTFLDANIVLEAILRRDKYLAVKALFKLKKDFCVSFLSVHLIYYFGIKANVKISDLDKFMENMNVLNCNQEVYDLAKKIRKNDDFEAALQVATAIYNQVDEFYTLDTDLIKKYNNLIKITELK